LIISISGMRGIVGDNLTGGIAENYGRAFGTYLRAKYSRPEQRLSVCIGRDSRPSGPMLLSAVAKGLCSVGIDVIDLGIVTTPCVGIMIGELKCCGGVVITASHNPGQYNGIKLLLANAVAPPTEEAEQIRQNYYDKDFVSVPPADLGEISCNEKTDDIHIDRVLAIVDKDAITAKKFKVVLDSVNGAGGRITQKLLAELGCEITAINCEPTGIFAHTPEPTAANLTGLCQAVKAESAQIGFAQDPDADRLAIVDENGTYIGEEYTLALAAKYIFSRKTGNAATNLSTSRMIDDIARRAGGEVIRTAVGEANVAAAMMENNCIIGGEGNGGVIDLRIGPIRNSLLGIALVLQLMTDTAETISELVADIGGYFIQKEKFPAEPTQAKQILELAQKRFTDAEINTIDGCRFDFEDGWLHLRVSNTEPVMRVIAEAKDRQTAKKYIDAVSDIRREICG
jgi:phosphomannomutase